MIRLQKNLDTTMTPMPTGVDQCTFKKEAKMEGAPPENGGGPTPGRVDINGMNSYDHACGWNKYS